MKPGRSSVWISVAAILGAVVLGLLGWTAFTMTADLSDGVPAGAVGPLAAMAVGAVVMIAVFVILVLLRR